MNVMKISVPTSKRRHTFCTVELEGKEYWYDNTEANKIRAFDSVKLYQMQEGWLIFVRYIRKGLLYLMPSCLRWVEGVGWIAK